jgi:hypothetical protein
VQDEKQLNEKFSQATSTISHSDKQVLDINYDFDQLKMYFGEDYWVTDKICIHQPTIGGILEFGDSDFYSMVNTICANPTTFRLALWKKGIDWNKMSDYELFISIIRAYTPKDTHLLFGDLNFSWFIPIHDEEKNTDVLVNVPRNENGEPLPFNINEVAIIDEIVYMRLVKYIRTMFNINPKVEHAKNKATKEAIIWEDEQNLTIEKQKQKEEGNLSKSILLPLISGLVNHPGFKYKLQELKEVGIVQFMDSVQRLQLYENTTALLKGIYSGMIDSSKIKQKDLNWLKDLNE